MEYFKILNDCQLFSTPNILGYVTLIFSVIVAISREVINQFCLLLQTIQRRMLLVEGRVLNNLGTTSQRTVAIKERWLGNMEQGERREGSTLQTYPVILKTLFGSDVACDYLQFESVTVDLYQPLIKWLKSNMVGVQGKIKKCFK